MRQSSNIKMLTVQEQRDLQNVQKSIEDAFLRFCCKVF